MSDKLGIADRVHWHGALFDEMKISKIMLSSHAFIYTGSVGLSLIHGFNYGLPAIVHSNEKYHMPEFSAFEDNVNGMSFEKNKLEDLSLIINKIYALDNESYLSMSNNAIKTVKNSYNTEDMLLRFSNMIEDMRL
jgi:glycosyltransferase involved in cell wall biosynthesis